MNLIQEAGLPAGRGLGLGVGVVEVGGVGGTPGGAAVLEAVVLETATAEEGLVGV